MFRLIYNFFRYNHHKILTLQALFFSAWARLLLYFVPISKLRPHLGQEGVETPREPLEGQALRDAAWISNRVTRVARRTPWQSKCFVQALVAQWLLRARGLASTLYLGVGKDDSEAMIAHAWIRCGEHFITGGSGEGYATVARFARFPRGGQASPPAGEG